MEKPRPMKKINYRFSLQNSRTNSPIIEQRKSQNKINRLKQTLKPLRTMQRQEKLNPFLPISTKTKPKTIQKPAKNFVNQYTFSTIFQKQAPNKLRNITQKTSMQKSFKMRNNRIRIHTEQKTKALSTQNKVKTINKQSRDLLTRQQTHVSPDIQFTAYEQNQAKMYEIFYVGERRIYKDEDFTDQNGDPIIELGDSIMFRYEILGLLGSGAFGKVFKVYDHRRNQIVALKIIKNHPKYQKQAKIQIKILQQAILFDQINKSNIVQLKHAFLFRGHPCLSFQLLYINLYQFCQQVNFIGLSLNLIHKLSIQILQCLNFLQKNSIIHCDLKPQNIMIRRQNKTGIKIIDFGSGCFSGEQIYNYIQSRYYRAPEIALGAQYGMPIDMWSFGCIVVELWTGQPIFAGDSEADQVGLFVETLGMPPKELIERGGRSRNFFTENGQIKAIKDVKLRIPLNRPIQKILKRVSDPLFIDFVKKILKWVPEQRLKASECLSHPWIMAGIPEELHPEHLKLVHG